MPQRLLYTGLSIQEVNTILDERNFCSLDSLLGVSNLGLFFKRYNRTVEDNPNFSVYVAEMDRYDLELCRQGITRVTITEDFFPNRFSENGLELYLFINHKISSLGIVEPPNIFHSKIDDDSILETKKL